MEHIVLSRGGPNSIMILHCVVAPLDLICGSLNEYFLAIVALFDRIECNGAMVRERA